MRPTELPGASLTPEEIAKRASGRGSWHRRASKPVSYWMFGVIIAILVHRFIPKGGWLIVHMVTLGLITNSILIWSQHFTEALMKIKIPDSARGIQVTRIFALNGGIVLLMAGMILQDLMPQFYPLTVVGALAVGAMVAWHGYALLRQVKQALPSRFGATIRFYIAAAFLLPVGAVLGAMTALPGLRGTLHSQFMLAHEAVNVLGFVGITVVGTLITFWPTMLRTKMVENALGTSVRALILMCVGVGVTTFASLFGMRPLAGAGLLVYLLGLLIVAGGLFSGRLAALGEDGRRDSVGPALLVDGPAHEQQVSGVAMQRHDSSGEEIPGEHPLHEGSGHGGRQLVDEHLAAVAPQINAA